MKTKTSMIWMTRGIPAKRNLSEKKKKRKEPSEKAVLVIDQGRITVAGGGGQKQDIKKFIN